MRKPYEIDCLTHLTSVIKWNETKNKKKKKIMRINLKLLTLCYVKKLLIIGSRKKKINQQINCKISRDYQEYVRKIC